MAYNEKLTNRVREALAHISTLTEKKMFRGVLFMVNDKMCVGVGDNEIMCRFDPALHDTVLEKEGCREMIRAGRTIKGFVFVNEEAFKTKKELEHWLKLALDFNGKAKAAKKTKKR
ncbi:MAG: TfoX/Sxy family protein [Chitinophagaceae bacterium]|nr:TfoX/Sxy family protein [Chitinophagaceae bacterium]